MDEAASPPTQAAAAAFAASVFRPEALAGKRVLVTGASSGMGRAAALALSHCGAALIINGRDEVRLDDTLRSLAGAGHEAVAAEISGADQTADMIKATAKASGPLDGIFHAAGAYQVMPMKVTKQRHIDEVFAASVGGAYGIGRAAAQRSIMNDGGSVVFMSSVSAQAGHAGLAAYSGSKAAIIGLVRALAHEFAPRRVRVNAIVSATIVSEMLQRNLATAPDETLDAGAARHPLGYGTPADIANAVLFLMSDASRWVTGTAMAVDGGYLA